MEHLQSLHLRQIQVRLGGIAYELTNARFGSSVPQAWSPSINAYQCSERIVICVDLAGVEKSQVDLSVEARRILLRGRRRLLEPEKAEGETLQVLALEIDEGAFARELHLPSAVNPATTRAEQRNGILWIFLPLTGSEGQA